ncbi:MAG: SGNH/GDSL hydrolase family protein [Candidatus Hodarchaeales archaeon]
MSGGFSRKKWLMTSTIACIGNSHTAGFPFHDPSYGGDPKSTYIFWLEKKISKTDHKVVFTNHGVCGETSAQINARIPAILDKIRPTHAILISGANDIGWGVSNARIFRNIMNSIFIIKAVGVIPILCSIPPMDFPQMNTGFKLADVVEDLNEKLKSGSDQLNIPFADIWRDLVDDVTRGLQVDYDSGDGVHLNTTGYHRVAETIFPVLRELQIHE